MPLRSLLPIRFLLRASVASESPWFAIGGLCSHLMFVCLFVCLSVRTFQMAGSWAVFDTLFDSLGDSMKLHVGDFWNFVFLAQEGRFKIWNFTLKFTAKKINFQTFYFLTFMILFLIMMNLLGYLKWLETVRSVKLEVLNP